MNKVWLSTDKSELIKRLSRVEGQVRALKDMVEEADDFADLIQQMKAARSAIDQIGRLAIREYVKAELKGAKAPLAQFEKYDELVKKYGR